MPRNRVRIGIEKTCIRRAPVSASAVGLAVGEPRDRVEEHELARCPRARVLRGDPAPAPRRGRDRRPRTPPPGFPTRGRVRRAPPASATAGCRRSRRRDGRCGHVDAAADHHVVDPAEHGQPAVLVEPAGVGGQEPAVHQRLGGQLRVTVVPVEQRRPGDPDPALGADRDRHPVQRHPVVDAAAGGLRRAVRRHHPQPLVGRPGPEPGVDRAAAEQDGVRGAQRGEVRLAVEQPEQLGRHQRGEPGPVVRPLR